MENKNIFVVKNLRKTYPLSRTQALNAVDGITFEIRKGETLGLVGESGCGKSTLGKLLLNLEQADEGEVLFHDTDISGYDFKKMRPLRRQLQMIFQNSSDSFNPYYTIRHIIAEPLDNYRANDSPAERETLVSDMINRVGLDESYLDRFASELSGGQRQRIGIARALILTPEFVVCDEPVSSLDYAIRNKIITLLNDLKKSNDLTYLFISHDISAINQICDRVMVMYRGSIMEILPSLEDKTAIRHPYTKALMAATLGIDPRDRKQNTVLFRKEEREPGSGCPFYHRCLEACDDCSHVRPGLVPVDDKGHYCACHKAGSE